VATNKVNRKAWESLVKSGAFDSLADRSDILFNLDEILAFGSKLQKEKLSGQEDLFSTLADDSSVRSTLSLKPAPKKYTEREQLMWERELMGLYISAHPLDNYDAFFDEQVVSLSRMLPNVDGQNITIGGLVTTVRTIVTKSGKKMAFVAIEDRTGEGEIIVFPNLYEEIGASLEQDAIIRAVGKVSARDRDGNMTDEAKMIADEITTISEKELRDYKSTGRTMAAPSGRAPYRRRVAKNASADKVKYEAAATLPSAAVEVEPYKTVYLRVDDANDTDTLLVLKSVCNEFPGDSDVVLVLGPDKKALRMPFRVNATSQLTSKLQASIGAEAVVLK
jgi:DNA polymerase-3 subunit alpha